jgi:hypothetical protein
MMRSMSGNLNTQDYVKKINAFFEYAWYDPEIVRLLHLVRHPGYLRSAGSVS